MVVTSTPSPSQGAGPTAIGAATATAVDAVAPREAIATAAVSDMETAETKWKKYGYRRAYYSYHPQPYYPKYKYGKKKYFKG